MMNFGSSSQFSVLSSQFSVKANIDRNYLSTSSCGLYGRDQAIEYLAQLRRLVQQGPGLIRAYVLKVLSDCELSFNFNQGTSRMTQKVVELLPGKPGLTFRDVTGYRNSGSS